MADWSRLGRGRSSLATLAPSLAGDAAAARLVGPAPAPVGQPPDDRGAHARLLRDRHAGDPAHRSPSRRSSSTGPTIAASTSSRAATWPPTSRARGTSSCPGVDHLPWVNGDDILAEIEEFVTGERPLVEPDRVLATVLFSDIVGSTERAAELGDRRLDRRSSAATTRRSGASSRGIVASRSTRPATASWPASTARPGRSAARTAIHAAVAPLGLRAARRPPHRRGGAAPDSGLGGIAVHIGARVASLAGRGETLVSSTVRDLTAGSGLAFEDRGLHALKGVPGEWRIYAAV